MGGRGVGNVPADPFMGGGGGGATGSVDLEDLETYGLSILQLVKVDVV